MNKIIDLLRLSEFKEKIISLIPTKVSQLDNDLKYVTQTEVEDLKKSVSDGKKLVADAITDKGVTTAAGAEFATMAENIGQIKTVSDIKLQEKTVKSSKQLFTITPDIGYNGLSKVTVNPIKLTDYKMKSFITTDPNASMIGGLMENVIGQQYDGISEVKLSGVLAQSKTVSPSTSVQTIKPDSGYDALNSVTVNAIKNQSKSVTPATSAQTIKPDSGYNGLSQVTINAAKLQNKSVAPTSSIQTIYPDSGFYGLGAVSVAAATQTGVKTVTLLQHGVGSNANDSATARYTAKSPITVLVIGGYNTTLTIPSGAETILDLQKIIISANYNCTVGIYNIPTNGTVSISSRMNVYIYQIN